tara:strand:+ start:10827 stop:11057 length:231 start_codon:yes stop_codon:yes gene_type:complete
MVNTFEILNSLDDAEILPMLVRKGIVPITFLDYRNIYEKYLEYRKKNGKMQSYESTATDCNVSEVTVRIVVKRMES